MNQSQIAKALREAVFSPGKPGPLKVIADVGNINYYIRRATEFLTLSLTALTREQRIKYFDSALGMIALAKVKTRSEVEKTVPQTQELATVTGVEETNSSVNLPAVTRDCTQDNCVPEKCFAGTLCHGRNVLDTTKEIYGKDDEVDKPKQGGVQSPCDCVREEYRNRYISNIKASNIREKQVPEKVQSRLKIASGTEADS